MAIFDDFSKWSTFKVKTITQQWRLPEPKKKKNRILIQLTDASLTQIITTAFNLKRRTFTQIVTAAFNLSISTLDHRWEQFHTLILHE